MAKKTISKVLAYRLFDEAFTDGFYRPRRVKTLSNRTLKRKVQRIARDIGVTLSKREARSDWFKDDGTWCWNGVTIATGRRDLSNIVHDIAHHQCSAPNRRSLPEWGLGTSPDGTKKATRVVSESYAQREEECASILGILWERAIGMNWTETAELHSWDMPYADNDRHSTMARALKKLLKWGLIDDDLNPLPNLRPAFTKC